MNFSTSGQLPRSQYKRGSRYLRGARFFSSLFWLLIVAVGVPLPALAVVDEYRQVEELAANGVPAFALRRLDQEQPEYYRDFQSWMRWERLRIGIYGRQGDWQAMLTRLQHLPRGLPSDFRLWGAMQQVQGYGQLGRNEEAQALLTDLIWGRGAVPDSETLRQLRHQMIALYLAVGRVRDALGAVGRYRLDYADDSLAWRLLYARVLLSSGQVEAALVGLSDISDPVAQALRLIADIREGESGESRYDQAVTLAPQLNRQTRHWFWWALATVASERQATRLQLLAFEALTALQPAPGARKQALLSAYASYAEVIAREAGLSLSDAVPLMQPAARQVIQDPLAARALYAYLSRDVTEPALRNAAHQKLAELLSRLHEGALLRHLYPANETLPEAIYPALVDSLLAAGELEEVARVFTVWKRPADDEPLYQWQLAWARFSLHADKLDDGLALLTQLLADARAPSLPDGVVAEALRFGERVPETGHVFVRALLARQEASEITPGLWYRIGVFFGAAGDDVAAVPAFLRVIASSADTAGARSARRKLAAALGRLGARADARRIYHWLLQHEDDPLVRVELENALHGLEFGGE